MQYRLNIKDLKTPEEVEKLVSSLSEAFDQLDVMYSTTAPNGSISGRQGQLCLYNNSGTYSLWVNTTGSTVWQQIDGANKALSNLASVAINESLISDTDNTDDLGSATKEFKDLYIDGLAYIDQLGEDLDFNGKQAVGLLIENKTSDPTSPVTGQIWFRTDI